VGRAEFLEMKWLRLLVPIVPVIAPLVARWVREQEAGILVEGVSLTDEQARDARRVGVNFPEKVRLKWVDSIPTPEGFIGWLGVRTGLINPRTAGITLGYGIYLRSAYWNDRELCVHELVYIGQYERLGSIEDFLRPYLRECLDPGYPWGPLEQEAVIKASDIVRGA
jgi:hypothetical protein